MARGCAKTSRRAGGIGRPTAGGGVDDSGMSCCWSPAMTGHPPSHSLAQGHVAGGTSAGDVLHALVAQCTRIAIMQLVFPGTEQDGRGGQVELVTESGAQILPDGGYAATQSN